MNKKHGRITSINLKIKSKIWTQFYFKSDFIGRVALVDAMKFVPTRSTVHLQISPDIVNLEPEGDETVMSEGKPVG